VTVRRSLVRAVIRTVNRPLGSRLRFTGAVIRARRTVRTRRPLTITVAATHVTPASRRMRIVKRLRLTQRRAEGSVNATVGLIRGRPGARVPSTAAPAPVVAGGAPADAYGDGSPLPAAQGGSTSLIFRSPNLAMPTVLWGR